MFHILLKLSLAGLLLTAHNVMSLPKTGGTPIGGLGTGYVKYNARSGDFAASGKIPPAASDQENEFLNKKSLSSGFHFFAGGKSMIKARTNSEDAKFPLYTADYGITNEIKFSLRAFGPFIPGNNPLYYKLATSPLAYFEITAENTGAEAMEVAVAMEFTNKSTTKNLLGGADEGIVDSESQYRAISFQGVDTMGNGYLIVNSDGNSPLYSAGILDSFSTKGTLTNSNGKGNLVAGKCSIPSGGSVRFKFTLAWWRMFVSTSDRYGTGKNDEDNYYYHNFYTSSKNAAIFGEQYFDQVSSGAKNIVNRVKGSNFPDWYTEKLLNNLYPMTNNSVCAKDGRTAFSEGLYPVIGSIDQAEHASLWYTFNWPQNQWLELQYWLRTAHRGVNEDSKLKGQIHHDFNSSSNNLWNRESHFICPWDDYLRKDYWWSPNTTTWADLNIMAIFKFYELMLATGNRDSLLVYYPKILLTAERLLTQCAETKTNLPLDSKSTYDSGDFKVSQYVSGISLVAFLAMEEIAKFLDDTSTAGKYREWYTVARAQFKEIHFNADFCQGRFISEGDIAGYSWGNYFCLEPVMDKDVITTGCQRLWQFYTVSSSSDNRLGYWHFYTCDHWGGAEIARGAPDTAMTLFKFDYDYYHTQNPEFVFWQDLWNTNQTYASYVTAPSVWRSYFQMTGYLLDNANKRLWIRPKIPSSMQKKIISAPLLNPEGWGTLDYDESGNSPTEPVQIKKVAFDSAVTIRELVLKNNTNSDSPICIISNHSTNVSGFTVKTEDWGIEKNIRITFATPVIIDKNGLNIQVSSSAIGTVPRKSNTANIPLSIKSGCLRNGKAVTFSVNCPGVVIIDLLALNGARIGIIHNRFIGTPGTHSFVWNGKTIKGMGIAPRIMIMRLATPSGSVSRQVLFDNK